MGKGGRTELRVSSPGKVILFGEHAVVYGKTAVAASLNLRSTLILRECPELEFSEIKMPGVDLSIRLSTKLLQTHLLDEDDDDDDDSHNEDNEELLHSHLLRRARDHVRDHVEGSSELDQRQRCSLECTLYALVRIARAEGLRRLSTSFQLELSTELPLGAGLGSSASFSVCLTAGFLIWARLCKTDRTMVQRTLDQQSLRRVSNHALGCEKIMHGAPSGVDNEVCTFGSAIEFRKGEDPKQVPLVGRLAELRVLLVDTKVARSTKMLVDKLAGLNAQYPQVFETVFESIDRLCRRVLRIITDSNTTEDAQLREVYRQLSDLIDVNQGLLTTCQVSHPTIDAICAIAKKHGLSAKLTGAGGGGFVYVLVPPGMPADKLSTVTSELTVNGFSVIETTLGGSGLSIFYDNH